MLVYNSLRVADICVGLSILGFVYSLVRNFLRSRTPNLSGPKRTSWFWGVNRDLLRGVSGDFFDEWQIKFGHVYRIPTAMGGERIVFMDPRAIAYIFNGNVYNFQKPEGLCALFRSLVGDDILSAEGEVHKRYRKAMSPGFAPAAIRSFTSIFLEAAHSVEDEWSRSIEESKGDVLIVDIEDWMNRISMDTIGLAGFSHSFNAVRGNVPAVMRLFQSLGKLGTSNSSILVLGLLQVAPWILKLPFKRNETVSRLHSAMSDVAKKLLSDRKTDEKAASEDRRSIVLSLMKAENRTMTEEEVLCQLNTLILAGYETTSTAMTWAIHELSAHPKVQDKLRSELRTNPEATHDQLASDMPYLDAVVKETLRLHAAFPEVHRIAMQDDTIPLSTPVTKSNGDVVDHVEVRAGTGVIVPADGVNRSRTIWGPDAHAFKPERWFAALPPIAKELQGYHHIMSFGDGPRACIGKNFGVAEIKAVLLVLVCNFAFSPLKDGADVKRTRAIGSIRARNTGKEGLFIRVQRVDVE